MGEINVSGGDVMVGSRAIPTPNRASPDLWLSEAFRRTDGIQIWELPAGGSTG